MTRYAEGTKVTVDSSRGEITGILAKHGVERMAWATEPAGDTLQFELHEAQYRFVISKPIWSELAARFVRDKDEWDRTAAIDAEWRRRWRANVLLLKAKLEFAAGDGPSTITRELMPYRLLANGKTLEEAIEAGGLPMLAAGRKGR